MKDAVIGVAKGYDWPELRNYAVSLSRCGFEGEKLMFVDGLTEEATKNLIRLGFTLVPYENPAHIRDKKCGSQEDAVAWGVFGRWRFKPVIEYLALRIEGFRYIVWCDVRDVMFQTDPAVWMAEHMAPAKLIGAAEGYLIKDQPHNAFWAQCTAPHDYTWLQNEEVICSGTFAGEAQTMLKVFEHMFWLHENIEDPRAFDQGLWNFTARSSPFKEVFRIPKLSEGFCATGWPGKETAPGMTYRTDKSPVYLSDLTVAAPDTGLPYSIVHQYDRNPQWAGLISQIMVEAEKPPIILIGSCEAWRHNGFNQAARDTWIKDLAGRFEYRFLLGRECENPGPDELILDAPDDYRALPYKTQMALRWATANGYGRRFLCGADTFVIASRFPAEDYESHHYLGYMMHDHHRLCKDRDVIFAQGGAGYWISAPASQLVEKAEIPAWVKFADDVFVGDTLSKAGVPFSHDEGYWPRAVPEENVPKHDYGSVEWKTFHLSKWRGEPKYESTWMYETHELWK
jgi:hypothetical protein